jgi:hypothetical protein
MNLQLQQGNDIVSLVIQIEGGRVSLATTIHGVSQRKALQLEWLDSRRGRPHQSLRRRSLCDVKDLVWIYTRLVAVSIGEELATVRPNHQPREPCRCMKQLAFPRPLPPLDASEGGESATSFPQPPTFCLSSPFLHYLPLKPKKVPAAARLTAFLSPLERHTLGPLCRFQR